MLARVVGAGVRRVAAMVGGEDEEVALRVEQLEPLADRGVDLLRARRGSRPRRCGGRRPGRSPRGWRTRGRSSSSSISRVVSAIPAALVGALCCSSTPTPLKTWPILPTVWTGTPDWRSSSRYERPGGSSAMSFRPSVRRNAPGSPANGRAITRPTACSPVMIRARRGACLVELGQRDDVLVGRDLQHRVGRRVHDQVAGLHVALAEVVDHLGAGVRPVAQRPAAGRLARASRTSSGKPSG